MIKNQMPALAVLLASMMVLGFVEPVFATVGAVTLFTSFEAENGTLGGGATIQPVTSPPTNQFSSPQLEASGHAFVQLTNTGQFVEWTNTTGQSFTAVNLRSCIPDAPAGGGISNTISLYVNGTFRQGFSVNSLQNYCYEGTNYNGQEDKNPADGNPRGFWNDTHAFLSGAALAPGDRIRFQTDSTNTAAFYYIDVIDLETPPAPLAQPANSLSIVSYGAVSNNIAFDNSTAINNCFIAAQAQGKMAYIPPGTFYFSSVNSALKATNITIVGAGPWYSTLYRVTPTNNTQGVVNMIEAVSCTMSNLLLDCNGSSRAVNNNLGAIDFSGNNWVVDNVWIQHVTSSFWCAGFNGIAKNCRTLSVWSDGGNFNNVQSSAGVGINLTYSNNFVRGTGDDAMAINSVNYNDFGSRYFYTTMSNIAYVNNTAIGAWGGKNMGIYGGINVLVTNNLLCDTARYLGLGVGKFGVNGSELQSARVIGNVILRCGGNGYSQQQSGMMIGNGGDGQSVGSVANAYCWQNIISNALFNGVSFTACTNIVFQRNTIIAPGFNGITVDTSSSVIGFAIVNSNSVSGLSAGYAALTNSVSSFATIVPTMAASYTTMSGVATETCLEGGQDLTSIANGDWAAYNGIDLTGANAFVARVSSATLGGNIEVRLDSPAGTLAGVCPVTGTGGWQNFIDAFCTLTNASGTHTVYLVFTGGSSSLFNVEFFGTFTASPSLSHRLLAGNTCALQSVLNGQFVSATNGGNNTLAAKGASVSVPQQFQIYDAGGGNIAFLALVNTNYVAAESNGSDPLIANRAAVGSWETFSEFDAGNGNIALRAMNNGNFVTVSNNSAGTLIAKSASIGTAESFTPQFVSGAAPASPGGLMVWLGNGRIGLTWAATSGATSYNLKRAETYSGTYSVIVSNLANPFFTDSNLVNGTTYYYAVTAQNPAGESTNSSPVAAVVGSQPRWAWMASSSSAASGNPPVNAVDGDINTRWSSGTSQTNGMWFQVDLGAANTFRGLILDATPSSGDYPRGYQVNVSSDGVNWGSAVATGASSSAITTITFANQTARYIRITQTGSVGLWWSIHELNVLGTVPATPSNLAGTSLSGTQIGLTWNAANSATGYNLKRAQTSGGPYTTVAWNLTDTTYTDSGLAGGTLYYYVATATNGFGESPISNEVAVRPVSTAPTALGFVTSGGQIQLSWPLDHTGWRLEAQTNGLSAGLGTNWITVSNSTGTNTMVIPVNTANGSVFFRLRYP